MGSRGRDPAAVPGQNLNTAWKPPPLAPWEHLWAMAQYCHTVFVDLKHMDSAKHKALTGVPNEQILENIRRLCEELPKTAGEGHCPHASGAWLQ